MLRQIFFGTDMNPACGLGDLSFKGSFSKSQEAVCFGNDCVLPADAGFEDAKPRELFIAACFIGLILAIGIYPKFATGLYDATTVAINGQVRQSYLQFAQKPGTSVFAKAAPTAPTLKEAVALR
jgi:NAD(P)H-quinone oxidoreductase subunit 4